MTSDTKEEAATIPIDFVINFVEINISQMEKPCGILQKSKINIQQCVHNLILDKWFWEIEPICNAFEQCLLICNKSFLTSRQNSANLFERTCVLHMSMIYSDNANQLFLVELKWKFFVSDTTILNTIKLELSMFLFVCCDLQRKDVTIDNTSIRTWYLLYR